MWRSKVRPEASSDGSYTCVYREYATSIRPEPVVIHPITLLQRLYPHMPRETIHRWIVEWVANKWVERIDKAGPTPRYRFLRRLSLSAPRNTV
jgi:hypothetical protein